MTIHLPSGDQHGVPRIASGAYDLARDPNERQNVAVEHLATEVALRGELLRMTQHVPVDRDAFLPLERLQALEALGYVGR